MSQFSCLSWSRLSTSVGSKCLTMGAPLITNLKCSTSKTLPGSANIVKVLKFFVCFPTFLAPLPRTVTVVWIQFVYRISPPSMLLSANKRPVSRSCDRSRPIRRQYLPPSELLPPLLGKFVLCDGGIPVVWIILNINLSGEIQDKRESPKFSSEYNFIGS